MGNHSVWEKHGAVAMWKWWPQNIWLAKVRGRLFVIWNRAFTRVMVLRKSTYKAWSTLVICDEKVPMSSNFVAVETKNAVNIGKRSS